MRCQGPRAPARAGTSTPACGFCRGGESRHETTVVAPGPRATAGNGGVENHLLGLCRQRIVGDRMDFVRAFHRPDAAPRPRCRHPRRDGAKLDTHLASEALARRCEPSCRPSRASGSACRGHRPAPDGSLMIPPSPASPLSCSATVGKRRRPHRGHDHGHAKPCHWPHASLAIVALARAAALAPARIVVAGRGERRASDLVRRRTLSVGCNLKGTGQLAAINRLRAPASRVVCGEAVTFAVFIKSNSAATLSSIALRGRATSPVYRLAGRAVARPQLG